MSNSRPRQSNGLIKHGTVMLVATVITGLSNTLFYVLMIRRLTREDFGDYNGLISLHYILIMPFAAVQIVTARYVPAFESQHMLGQAASLLRRSIFKLSLTFSSDSCIESNWLTGCYFSPPGTQCFLLAWLYQHFLYYRKFIANSFLSEQ